MEKSYSIYIENNRWNLEIGKISMFLLFSNSLVPYRKFHYQGYIIIGSKISSKKSKELKQLVFNGDEI